MAGIFDVRVMKGWVVVENFNSTLDSLFVNTRRLKSPFVIRFVNKLWGVC